MAMDSESVLIERFSLKGDSEAFAEIVRRHVRMVYGVCLRILGDESAAVDATQETFFLLIRQGRHCSGSLSSWLHTVATRRSIDLIRRDQARRKREHAYTADRQEQVETWHELSVHVDEAIEDLSEEMRSVLMEHFFEGKTTSEIAAGQNVSQATVSRRINQGLDLLHASLKRRGLLATTALATLLTEATTQAVPAAVVRELTKMTLVGSSAAAGTGTVAGVGAKAGTSGLVFSLQAKVLTVAAVAALGTGTAVLYDHYSPPPHTSQEIVANEGAAIQPTPVRRIRSTPTTLYRQNGLNPGLPQSQDPPNTLDVGSEETTTVAVTDIPQDGGTQEPTGVAMMGSYGGMGMGGMAVGSELPSIPDGNESVDVPDESQ